MSETKIRNNFSLISGSTVYGISNASGLTEYSNSYLSTQKAIKDYVDAQVSSSDTLAEVLANGNQTDGTNIILDGYDYLQFGDGHTIGQSSESDLLRITSLSMIEIVAAGSVAAILDCGSMTTAQTFTFPDSTGTFALTTDIPTMTLYVTTGTTQTVSGYKTFTSGITMSGDTTISYQKKIIFNNSAETSEIEMNILNTQLMIGKNISESDPTCIYFYNKPNGNFLIATELNGLGSNFMFENGNLTTDMNSGSDGNASSFLVAGDTLIIKSGVTNSAIIGGEINTIDYNLANVVILGGNNITATASNTVYTPDINIGGDVSNGAYTYTFPDESGYFAITKDQDSGNALYLKDIVDGTSYKVYVSGGTLVHETA